MGSSGPPSRGEKSESKTSGRTVKRQERTKADDQSTGFAEEKPISQRNQKRNKMNGSMSFSEKSIDSEKVVGEPSKNVTESGKSRSVAFGGQDDFIPFGLSESSDEEESETRSGKDQKWKQKAIEDEYSSGREKMNREKDRKGKDRDDPPSRRGLRETSGRELDHGQRQHDQDDYRQSRRDGNLKRKYDEFQGDDRNRTRKQRFDSLSNKCPWITGVDLEKCRNVADM